MATTKDKRASQIAPLWRMKSLVPQFLGTTFLPQSMEIRLTVAFKLFTGMNVYELVYIHISPCGELAACPKCGLLTIKSFLLFLEVFFSAQIIKNSYVINNSMYY